MFEHGNSFHARNNFNIKTIDAAEQSLAGKYSLTLCRAKLSMWATGSKSQKEASCYASYMQPIKLQN